jgi:hypothetical protein
LDATEDFDLAWAVLAGETVLVTGKLQSPVLSMLKAVDSTYEVLAGGQADAESVEGSEGSTTR